MRDVIEREVKLEAPADFVLPDLSTLEGARALPVTEVPLDSIYFDTPDLRLARSGISVRHRLGDATGWTVKLPEDSSGSLARRELNYGGAPGSVPPQPVGSVPTRSVPPAATNAFSKRISAFSTRRARSRRAGLR